MHIKIAKMFFLFLYYKLICRKHKCNKGVNICCPIEASMSDFTLAQERVASQQKTILFH